MQHDVVGGEPAALDDLNAFGQFHRSVRLVGNCASTARFSTSLRADQAAISSSVRKQPSHRPVSGFIRHTLLHGEGTSPPGRVSRSEEHTSELQSRQYLVCRLLLEKKKKHRNV